MLNTVLFDMGGTLEDIWNNQETQAKAMDALQKTLRAHGLEPGCSPEEFDRRVMAGLKEYKRWSEGLELEKKPEEIWPDYYLKEFGFNREKLIPITEELANLWEVTYSSQILWIKSVRSYLSCWYSSLVYFILLPHSQISVCLFLPVTFLTKGSRCGMLSFVQTPHRRIRSIIQCFISLSIAIFFVLSLFCASSNANCSLSINCVISNTWPNADCEIPWEGIQFLHACHPCFDFSIYAL